MGKQPSNRLLATLGLCGAAAGCDTFAQAPESTRNQDAPLESPTPVRAPPPAVVTAPTVALPTSTVPSASAVILPPTTTTAPALTTAAAPTATPPRPLPTCPAPTPDDTTDFNDSSTAPSGVEQVSMDAGSTFTTDTMSAEAGISSSSAQLAPPLPSGDTVLVDDLTLLVVFDNSGSMAECWDGKTRWEHAIHALRAAIEPAQHSLKVGAIRFPTDEGCLVDPFGSSSQFAFGLGHEFLADWDAHTRYPVGSTPLATALVEADKAIQAAADTGLLEERFRVLILTDGEPNCDGSLSLLTTLPTAWRTQGVETHVLGLPGSTGAATLLQEIADAGGGVYEQLTTPGALHESSERAAR